MTWWQVALAAVGAAALVPVLAWAHWLRAETWAERRRWLE
jgi:hypothetical protein